MAYTYIKVYLLHKTTQKSDDTLYLKIHIHNNHPLAKRSATRGPHVALVIIVWPVSKIT